VLPEIFISIQRGMSVKSSSLLLETPRAGMERRLSVDLRLMACDDFEVVTHVFYSVISPNIFSGKPSFLTTGSRRFMEDQKGASLPSRPLQETFLLL
jgi:hypothetical protein